VVGGGASEGVSLHFQFQTSSAAVAVAAAKKMINGVFTLNC
jgi:hypothetical protein